MIFPWILTVFPWIFLWFHDAEGSPPDFQARGSSVAAWRLTRSDAALGGPAVLSTPEICRGLRVHGVGFLGMISWVNPWEILWI